jgi:outer membrane protein assembly factor BamD (BamD/ComL family)
MKTTAKAERILILVCVSIFILCLAACKSLPKEEDIPPDLSAAALTQLAQTSYDGGNIALSELYYRVLAQRFANELAIRLSAEYEIAHIKIKQKKWEDAAAMLATILDYYKKENAYTLPQAYYKLAVLDMKKIPERYTGDTQ